MAQKDKFPRARTKGKWRVTKRGSLWLGPLLHRMTVRPAGSCTLPKPLMKLMEPWGVTGCQTLRRPPSESCAVRGAVVGQNRGGWCAKWAAVAAPCLSERHPYWPLPCMDISSVLAGAQGGVPHNVGPNQPPVWHPFSVATLRALSELAESRPVARAPVPSTCRCPHAGQALC